MLLPIAAKTPTSVEGEKPPLVARFLPSLTDIAFLMPVMFLFIKLDGARSLLSDGDTGWHVRTGEWILANHRVPHTDLFSFSRPGAPWFAWEWLWDVMFAMLHQRWGMAAVVLASLAVLCVTNAMLFRLARRKCHNSLVAVAVTLLAAGGCAIHWLARPHIFTLLFFALTLHITDRAAEGRTRLLWWLVPLTLVWTNIHGGFFVLFLVLGCYVGGNLLNAAIERDAVRRMDLLRAIKPWVLTALACFAVTFVNPYGWELHRHIFLYITDPFQLVHITEFQSMNFHSPVAVFFEPLMAAAILTAMWDAWNRRFSDVLLNLGWLHLGLIAQRNIPIFAIAATPLVARAAVAGIQAIRTAPLADWLRRTANWFTHSSAGIERTDRIGRVYLASLLPLALVGALLFAPRPAAGRFTSTFDPSRFPEGAISALSGPETQRIFAEDQWGDYLIYRLYPAKRVFIDGRSDFYGDNFDERYLDLIDVKYDWEQQLDQYGIDTVVIAPRFALASTLKISRDWRVAYDDGRSIVFRRNRPNPVSLVSSDEGKIRDRLITKRTPVDPGSPKPGTTPTT